MMCQVVFGLLTENSQAQSQAGICSGGESNGENWDDVRMRLFLQVFDILKPGCQGQLLPSDVYSLPVESYRRAMEHFMSVEMSQQGGVQVTISVYM